MKTKVLAALLGVVGASGVNAMSISVDSYDNGWYDQNGLQAGEVVTPDTPYPYNTYTGNGGGVEFRSFYNFDLSAIPVGSIVSSASVTFHARNGQFNTNDPTETIEFYDVTSLPGDHSQDSDVGKNVFVDLGTGQLYGAHTLNTQPIQGLPKEFSTLVPGFTVDLNSASFIDIALGSTFSLGAKLSTADANEGIWSTPYLLSQDVLPAAKLTIEYNTAPLLPIASVSEPGTLALMIITLAGLGFSRRVSV